MYLNPQPTITLNVWFQKHQLYPVSPENFVVVSMKKKIKYQEDQ